MRPLGFIEDWESFSKELGDVLRSENSIGFLLDCPKHTLLKKSGIIDAPASVRLLEEIMGDQMSIYYMSPKNIIKATANENLRDYKETSKKFNDMIITGLNIKFRVNYPCLIIFKSKENLIGDRIYIDLERDMCFYFSRISQAVTEHLNNYPAHESQDSSFRLSFKNVYQIAKEELPKFTFIQIMEQGVASLGAYLLSA